MSDRNRVNEELKICVCQPIGVRTSHAKIAFSDRNMHQTATSHLPTAFTGRSASLSPHSCHHSFAWADEGAVANGCRVSASMRRAARLHGLGSERKWIT